MGGLFLPKENKPSTLNYIFQCKHQPMSIKMALESIISGWPFQSISDQLCAKEKYADPLKPPIIAMQYWTWQPQFLSIFFSTDQFGDTQEGRYKSGGNGISRDSLYQYQHVRRK
jgi:hypothetical protein